MSKIATSLINKVWSIMLLLTAAMSASYASAQALTPAPFATQVSGEGEITVTGWLLLRGEVMLFSSREALRQKKHYPECISGVFKDQTSKDLSKFDGKRVTLTGRLYRFDALEDEDAPLLKRKVLERSVIPNFCFGENVLLISAIKKAR
jgi:hypothetical protein